jgi:hypothetical protein
MSLIDENRVTAEPHPELFSTRRSSRMLRTWGKARETTFYSLRMNPWVRLSPEEYTNFTMSFQNENEISFISANVKWYFETNPSRPHLGSYLRVVTTLNDVVPFDPVVGLYNNSRWDPLIAAELITEFCTEEKEFYLAKKELLGFRVCNSFSCFFFFLFKAFFLTIDWVQRIWEKPLKKQAIFRSRRILAEIIYLDLLKKREALGGGDGNPAPQVEVLYHPIFN